MPSAAYIQAAKQARDGKREPVVLLRVEDVAAIVERYTTQADWEGSVTLTEISATDIVGTATQERHDEGGDTVTQFYDMSGSRVIYTDSYVTQAAPYDSFLSKLRVKVFWQEYLHGNTITLALKGTVNAAPTAPYSGVTEDFTTDVVTVSAQGTVNTAGGIQIVPMLWGYGEFTVSPGYYEALLTSGDDVYLFTDVDQAFLGVWSSTGYEISADPHFYFQKETALLRTSTIDLGEVVTSPATFSVEDVVPSGTTLTYEAFADNSDPPTTSRGAVTDGDSIGAAGYRYYRIEASYTSTTGARPELQDIRISGGDLQFKLFSTHADQPVAGARPLLPKNPVGSLSSRIELDQPTSVGEIGIKLLWTREVGDMLATGFLRNKAVQVLHGFLGLSEAEFETIFTGSWANYTADPNKRLIEVSTQNVLRRFMKIKLPRETFSTTGTKSTTPLVFAADNAVQVILDLVDELGIPDRYIDRTTIEGLRDGALSGWEYDVTRTIASPVEAWKLVHELATLCGCFVVVLPSGKMTLVRYDEDASAATVLEANQVDFGTIDGGQSDLFTRQLIYYDPNVADPGEEETDYDKGLLLINAGSETAYAESSEHRWFEKWNAAGPVLAALADRWDRWQGTPRLRLTCSNVPLRHIGVLEGQVVRVTGLRVPCEAANWDVESDFRALVLKRTIDPVRCAMSFELLQISNAFPGFTTGFSLGFRS